MSKKITLIDGSSFTPLAEFDEGDSHIIKEAGCYVLVVRDDEDHDRFIRSPFLHLEALEQLRKLPLPKPRFTEAVQNRLDEESVRKLTKGR
jgi:hypothetical protein